MMEGQSLPYFVVMVHYRKRKKQPKESKMVPRIREHRAKSVYSEQFDATVRGVQKSFTKEYVSEGDFFVYEEGHNRLTDDRTCRCQVTNRTFTRHLHFIDSNGAVTALGTWHNSISNTADYDDDNCNSYINSGYNNFVDKALGNKIDFQSEIDDDAARIADEISKLG